MRNRNVLNVFIASPSDLQPERRVARDAVEQANEVLRAVNWSIELLGWEDTLPGYGRPQAVINKDVEACDLFVGILWRRWGTPTENLGRFSSGFEEEFDIAMARRQQTSSPEVWMFFKKVETEQANDPGEQLKRVLEFKQSLVENKVVLFKEFESTDEWSNVLNKYLLRHVLQNFQTKVGPPERPTEPTAIVDFKRKAAITGTTNDQILALTSSLKLFAETADPTVLPANQHDGSLAFTAVRLLLFSFVLVRESGTSTTLFPTHELNTLYRQREMLQPTEQELVTLLEAILSDTSDVDPGWYWFRDVSERDMVNRLSRIAAWGSQDKARARCFGLLSGLSVEGAEELREMLVRTAALEAPPTVHDGAWSYLLYTATTEDISYLRNNSAGTWLADRIESLDAWISSGRDLDRFLQMKPDATLFPPVMFRQLSTALTSLSESSVKVLASTAPRSWVKGLATAELLERGVSLEDLPPQPLNTLFGLAGGSLSGGDQEGENDQDRYRRLSKEDSTELQGQLLFYSIEGPVIYRILAERGEISRISVREDISTKFARLAQQSIERNAKRVGANRAAEFDRSMEKHREFLIRLFTEEAFMYLAERPVEDDIQLARDFLSNNDIGQSAVRIICSVGNETDVSSLIKIANSAYGTERKLALDGIQKLGSDKLSSGKSLLGASAIELRRVGLALLASVSNNDVLPILEEMLSDASEKIRLASVSALRSRLDHAGMEQLLARYVSAETYYYNVVTWLDRLIYAAPQVRKKLEEELDLKLRD